MEDRPLSFYEVDLIHGIAKETIPEVANMDLPTFSRYMNQQLGSNRYSAGESGAIGRTVKRISTGIDLALEPITKVTGGIGGDIGSLFGDTGEQIGQTVGEHLPRTLGQVATLATPATMPIGLADVFAKTYTDTGSPAAGAVSAATFGLAPVVAGKAAGAVASKLAPRALPGIVERGAEKAASLGGLLGTFEAGGQLSSLVQGQGFYNPLDTHRLAETAANVLPFELFGLPALVRGHKVSYKGAGPKLEPVGWKDFFKPEIENQVPSIAAFRRGLEADRAKVTEAADEFQQRVEPPKPVVTPPVPTDTVKPPSKISVAESAFLAMPLEQRAQVLGVSPWEVMNKDFTTLPKPLVDKFMGQFEKTGTPKTLPDEWTVSVQAEQRLPAKEPGGQELVVPGYVQIDEIAGGKNIRSTNAQKLQEEGYIVPDFSKLPQGKYTMAELAKGFPIKPLELPKVHEALRVTESEGATPQQLETQAQVLSQTPALPKESLADIAARETGLPLILNQPTEPGQFLAGVHNFFNRYFTLKGESGDRLNHLTRSAVRLAASFEHVTGRTRIAESTSPESFAVPRREGRFNEFVGVSTASFGADPALNYFRNYWDLAHELIHQVGFQAATGERSQATSAYAAALVNASRMTADEMGSSIQGLLNGILPKKNRDFSAVQNYSKMDPRSVAIEFLSDYGGLLAIGAANPSSRNGIKDAWFYSDRDTQNFFQGLYTDMTQAVSAVKEYLGQVLKSEGKESRIQDAHRHLTEVHENLVKILRSKDEVDNAVNAFYATMERRDALPSDPPPVTNWRQAQAYWKRLQEPGDVPKAELSKELEKTLDEAEEAMGKKPVSFGKRTSWYHWFMPFTQLAQSFKREVPSFKSASDLALSYRGLAANRTDDIWTGGQVKDGFVNEKGQFDLARLGDIGKEGTRLNSYINKVALTMQAQEKLMGGKELADFLRKEFPSISEKDIQTIDKSIQQMSRVAQKAGVIRLRSFRDSVGHAAGRLLMSKDPEIRHDAAIRRGQEVVNFLFDLDSRSHAESLAMREALYATKNPHLEDMIALVQESLPNYKKLQKKLLNRPYYWPEVRTGAWHIAWKTKDGVSNLVAFKNQKDAEARLKGLNEQLSKGELVYLKAFNKDDRIEAHRGLQADMVDVYRQADEVLFNSMLSRIKDPVMVAQIKEEFTPGEGALRSVTSPYMLERRLVGGRETLNMVESMIHYVDATSHGTSKRSVIEQMNLMLQNPDFKANPQLQNKAKEFITNVVSPTGREFTMLKNLVFFNYMGFNPSSLPIEATQPLLTYVPWLVEKGAGVGEAYKYLKRAWTEVGGSATDKFRFKDPELDAFVQTAVRDKVIDTGFISDLAAFEDSAFAARRNYLTGNGKITEARDLTANVMYHLLKSARDFYGIATRFNSRTVYVASFRYGKEKLGMDGKAADLFAREAVHTTLFGGGMANRPMALSGLGRAQGVGGVVYALQGYTFNMLSYMARLGRDSIAKSGLSTQEQSQARKAFALMLGTQAIFGGVMGLPLVAASVALIEQLFPDSQIRKNLRQAFHSLAGDDENMGHLVADGAMNGAFNVAVPFADVGSRFQLGNMLGVNPYEGFSWGNLGGPVTTMLENYTKAAQATMDGKPGQAIEKIAPQGVKGILKMYNDDWAVRDFKDRMIFDPTPQEKTLIALGFKPKRLTQYYEKLSLGLRQERIDAKEREDFHNEMAERLIRGDLESLKRGIEQKVSEYPPGTYSPKEALAEVVRIVQERQSPRDPLASGRKTSVEDRAQIGSLYPSQPRGQSEIEALRGKQQLMGSLGMGGRVSSSSLREAAMVDQLMAQNPTLTEGQARLMVQRMLQRRLY